MDKTLARAIGDLLKDKRPEIPWWDAEELGEQIAELIPRESLTEAEMKYAAESALMWMKGATTIPEVKPWVDVVTIQMLETAISHCKVPSATPLPTPQFDGYTEVIARLHIASMEVLSRDAQDLIEQAIEKIKEASLRSNRLVGATRESPGA